jgi:hypothetical protein
MDKSILSAWLENKAKLNSPEEEELTPRGAGLPGLLGMTIIPSKFKRLSFPIEVIAILGKSEILRDFLIGSKKSKNGKYLSITFLDFYRSNQKRSKRSPFRVL